MPKSVLFASALATVALGASSAGAAVLVASANSHCNAPNCSGSNLAFRQTFAADTFENPDTVISALRIDKSLVGDLQDSVLKIRFMRADGTMVSNWGGWVLAIIGGDTATISGPGFGWGRGQGDLVMEIAPFAPGMARSGDGASASAPPAFSGFAGLGGGGPTPSAAPPSFISEAQAPISAETPFMVPEPSTWALMILGFGAAGAMMRRLNRLQRPVVIVQPCG